MATFAAPERGADNIGDHLGVALASALAFPVTVVFAPPGLRAPALVRARLESAGEPYRAVDICAGATPMRVVRELARSLHDATPALKTALIDFANPPRTGDDGMRDLAQWAATHLASVDGTIVVDDVGSASSPDVGSFLCALVDATTPHIRWVIVSDRRAAFPIARWLADNRMDIPVDLLADAVTRAHPLPEQRLLARDAGMFDTAADPVACAAALLGALDPAVAQAVRVTVLCGDFDDAVLRAAAIEPHATVFGALRALAIAPEQDAGGIYRYDALVRSALRAAIRAHEPEARARAAERAAAALEAVGRIGDALEVAAADASEVVVGRLIARHGFDLPGAGFADAVESALARVDGALLEEHPVALAMRADAEMRRGNLDTGEAWYRLAIERLADPALRARAVLAFSIHAIRRDRSDVIAMLETHAAQTHGATAALLLGALAAAYANAGAHRQARAAVERAGRAADAAGDPFATAKVCHQTAYVALFARDYPRAAEFAERAVTHALASHHYEAAARSLSVLYNVASDHDDDMPAARRHLERMTDCSLLAGSKALELYATLARYEIEVIAGDWTAIAALDDELRSLEVYYSLLTAETLLPAQALRATWSGDFYEAYRLLSPSAANQLDKPRQAYRWSEIAVYAAAAALRDEAAAAIDAALALLRWSGSADIFAQRTKTNASLALTLIGRHGRASRLLADVTRVGRARSPRMDALVRAVAAIAERWTSGGYSVAMGEHFARLERYDLGGVARMLEALPLPESHVAQFGQLTESERAVLRHLAAGRSSKEIAALDGRSAQTIDVHIKSICRKLHCSGRRHAVAIATAGGFLA